MLPQNSRSPQSGNQNNPDGTSRLITRRSIVLGTLVALVPIAALVIAILGTLLTTLGRAS